MGGGAAGGGTKGLESLSLGRAHQGSGTSDPPAGGPAVTGRLRATAAGS